MPDGQLSNLLRLLKNEQKSDSFYGHFEQHFNTTTSRTDLRNYMTFKIVNSAKHNWRNEDIHKTKLEPMYGGTCNDPQKDTWQTRYGYE